MKKSVLDQLLSESGVAPKERMTVNTLIKEGMLLALVEDLGPKRSVDLLSELFDGGTNWGGAIADKLGGGSVAKAIGGGLNKAGAVADSAIAAIQSQWTQLPTAAKVGIGGVGVLLAAAGSALGARALIKRIKAAKSPEEAAKIAATIKAKAAANKAK